MKDSVKKSSSILGLLLIVPLSHAAQRYESNVVIPDQVHSPQSELVNLVSKLRDYSEQGDLSAIRPYVRDDFFVSKDVGDVFDPARQGVDNFISLLSLKEVKGDADYRGAGWEYLSALLTAGSYQKVGQSICTPANAVPLNKQRPDEFWLSWGYVHGSDVFLRKEPGLYSEPLASLSYEVVEPISGIKGEMVQDIDGNGLWLEVNTSKGLKGYMYSAYFRNFQQSQICFSKQDNQWKVSGLITHGH